MNQPLLRWNNSSTKKKNEKNDEDEEEKNGWWQKKPNRFQLMSIVKQFQMRKMVDWQP